MPNFSFLVCLEVVVLWLETTTKQQNSVELEASLAQAEAEVGAVAKADQKSKLTITETNVPLLANISDISLGSHNQ